MRNFKNPWIPGRNKAQQGDDDPKRLADHENKVVLEVGTALFHFGGTGLYGR